MAAVTHMWLLFVGCFVSVVTEQQTVTANFGQKATLPCSAPNNNKNTTLEWRRADLGEEYVLLHQDGHFDTSNQHPAFVTRVDLQDRQMKDGNMSLILKNVTSNDAGTYECRVLQTGKTDVDPICIIHLSVVPPDQKNITAGQNVTLSADNKTIPTEPGHTAPGPPGGDTEDGSPGPKFGLSVSAVLLVVVVVGGGYFIYEKIMKIKKKKPASSQPPTEEQTEMSPSADSAAVSTDIPEHEDGEDGQMIEGQTETKF